MNPRSGVLPDGYEREVRAWLDASDAWHLGTATEFMEGLFRALDMYGLKREDSMVPGLVKAYRVAVARLPVSVRHALKRCLVTPHNSKTSIAGVIPIIMVEPDRSIVQGGTFDILRYSRIGPDGRLCAEKVLVDILCNDLAENSGAVLAGMLLHSSPLLGDSLARVRRTFSVDQTREACLSLQGARLHFVLSFLFDWFMEVCRSDDPHRGEKLHALAAGLMPGADLCDADAVVSEIHANADLASGVMRYECLRRWSPAQYARDFLPALEQDVVPNIDSDQGRMLLSAWKRLADRP
jgi:hypothetical protein